MSESIPEVGGLEDELPCHCNTWVYDAQDHASCDLTHRFFLLLVVFTKQAHWDLAGCICGLPSILQCPIEVVTQNVVAISILSKFFL